MNNKQTNKQIQPLLNFMNMSPCNFLAIDNIKKLLEAAGFQGKELEKPLKVKSGDKFYVTKNDSAIFAITVGSKKMNETGVKIISAHSDSPGFRIKPHAEMRTEGGIIKLNTEVYGGPILYTWFDRPLSLAGRVILRGKDALHPVT
ncbi:MAG: M18 family aminopeptidase, partial [Muribaculaceae bacterium]|nr:M18 family aminopeptidase [Muribaculaceae bacterium]